MALIGGGGAGNIAGGANPTGTSSGLTHIGNHVYAYSGMIAANTNAQTCLNFNTGNEYSLVKVTLTGITENLSNLGNGSNSVYTIKINSEDVLFVKIGTDQEDSPTLEVIPLLLEPFSKVEISVVSGATSADLKGSVSIVGRVYA